MASLGQKDEEEVTKESLMKKYGLNGTPPEKKKKKKKKKAVKKKSGLTTRQDIKSAIQRRKEALD